MSLDKDTLKKEILAAFNNQSDQERETNDPAEARLFMAKEMADAIDKFVKSGTVTIKAGITVSTSGSAASQSGSTTSEGTGTIS